MLDLLRVHNYIKNLFVLTGILFIPFSLLNEVKWNLFFAFISFCLASSAVYIFNDLQDIEEDRHHPQKCNRPLPSGAISIKNAWSLFIVLLLATIISGIIAGMKVIIIIGIYFLFSFVYTLRLKHVVVIDVFFLASGYVLRVLAGTAGVGIPPSHWLLLCTLAISLFLGFGKRRHELSLLDEGATKHRKVLEDYSIKYLDMMMMVTVTASLVFYSLYTISPETVARHQSSNLVYTVPFVVYGLFRYMYLIYIRKGGGNPTLEILTDRAIQIDVALWALCVLLITGYS